MQTKAARRVRIFTQETLKHERNEGFCKEQEELKELRGEKGKSGRSGFQTMDTQGVGSGDKNQGKNSICHACIS